VGDLDRVLDVMAQWRRLYGESPLQLVALAASFALAAYAASKLLSGGHVIDILAWFVAAIIGHDVVLFPLYSALDRLAGHGAPRTFAGSINFLRAPAMFSGLLLLVYFPSILGLNAANYRAATSLDGGVYLARWLLITAALFVGSGLVFAVTIRRRDQGQPVAGSAAAPTDRPPLANEVPGDGSLPIENGGDPPVDEPAEPKPIASGDEPAMDHPAGESQGPADGPLSDGEAG
jgi:hypothetical protein